MSNQLIDISKHPLIKQAYEVCQAIEKCGASVELTYAVTKASALMQGIANAVSLLDELDAAAKRIAELSASHTNLREAMAGIHNTITGGGAYTPLASILNASKRAYEESAAAAGITVKGE